MAAPDDVRRSWILLPLAQRTKPAGQPALAPPRAASPSQIALSPSPGDPEAGNSPKPLSLALWTTSERRMLPRNTPASPWRSRRQTRKFRRTCWSSNASATWRAVESAASRQEARAPGRGTRVSSPTIRASTRRGRADARISRACTRGRSCGSSPSRSRPGLGGSANCTRKRRAAPSPRRWPPVLPQRAFSATEPNRSAAGGFPAGAGSLIGLGISSPTRRPG